MAVIVPVRMPVGMGVAVGKVMMGVRRSGNHSRHVIL